MKTIKSVFAALFLIAAVVMVSCDKDETASNLTVNLLKKGTIKGYVYAELDNTSAGIEHAPVGTKVVISVPYSQLNSSASGNYKDTVEVNAEGFFLAEVPTGNGTVTVTIYPMPFETNQIQELGSYETSIKKYFVYDPFLKVMGSSVSLSADEMVIEEYTYSDYYYDNFVRKAQISGNIYAQFDDTNADYEDVGGVVITFYGEGWNKSVTTGTDGSFSTEVPAYESIYYKYSFEKSCNLGGSTDIYLFEDDDYLGSFSGSVYDNEDIYLSSGSIVVK